MNLLKRLGIIVAIFTVFLAIRTLVAPPVVIIGRTAEDLKAYLCRTDWWDHSFTTCKLLLTPVSGQFCVKEAERNRFCSGTKLEILHLTWTSQEIANNTKLAFLQSCSKFQPFKIMMRWWKWMSRIFLAINLIKTCVSSFQWKSCF